MIDSLTDLPRRSIWSGWGDPAAVKPLSPLAWKVVTLATGVRPAPTVTPPVPLEAVRLPDVRLTPDDLTALRDLVGAEHVSTERLDRVEHAGGKSYPDLYRLRSGDGSHAPDAVLFPADGAQVVAVLAECSRRRIAVVPFGGGTSVVGGVDPYRGDFAAVISLDLRRLNALVDIDPVAAIATLQPGMRGPEAEAALAPHGLTIGHTPQSFQQATIGGFLVTRSSGQASSGYGRFEDHVQGLRLATPSGEMALGGRTPASATAAGPKLIDMVIGSEGLLGVVTEVMLQCHRAPTTVARAAYALPTFDAGLTAFRRLAQELGHGVMPDVSRLSDPDETRFTLGRSKPGLPALARLRLRGHRAPALAVFQWEGDDRGDLAWRQKRLARLLREEGAMRLPRGIAAHWMDHRFSGPYQRDDVMSRGIFVETLETATTWSNIERLYAALRAAISGALGSPAVIQCHVSHLYDGGASLYFTYLARAQADPLAQWDRVKQAAGAAIVAGGGTITHHHGVGLDHRAWVAADLGDLGQRMLRAVKDDLDPVGILNPGKLLPPLPGPDEPS